MKLLSILRRPEYFFFFIAWSFILLAVNTYFIVLLPGSNGYACIPGANITAPNILFAITLSLVIAFLITSILFLLRQKRSCSLAQRKSIMAFTGLSAGSGMLTVFCTICTLPLLSFLGFTVSFSLFTDYNGWFKGVSLLLAFIGLFLIERHIRNT